MPRTRGRARQRQETDVYSEHPLMYSVWHNHLDYLRVQLQNMADEDEDALLDALTERDLHGRTLLQLAVELFHRDAACELMAYGAQIEDKDSNGFTVLENVTATQDMALLHSTYLYWQYQRCVSYAYRISCIFEQFSYHNRDFYFEIDHTFDFTPLGVLVPLYPYTKYRVYKLRHKVCVEKVRVTSETQIKLLKSYIFVVSPTGDDGGEGKASMVILDHIKRTSTLVAITTSEPLTSEQVPMPDRAKLIGMINGPLVSTQYDMQSLQFEPETNLLGMAKTDKLKPKYIKQSNRLCAKFEAMWFNETTIKRVDHFERKNSLANLNYEQLCNPHGVSLTTYFTSDPSLPDIGIEKKFTRSRSGQQLVKLWLFKDNYPLTVPGHLMPVLELIDLTDNKSLDKCRAVVAHPNFPHYAGYPVKVEFFMESDLVYAIGKFKLTNFNGLSERNPNVTAEHVNKHQYKVAIKRELFAIPNNYYMLGGINI